MWIYRWGGGEEKVQKGEGREEKGRLKGKTGG